MRSSIALTEIEVISDTRGRPKLALHGEARGCKKEVYIRSISLT